MSNILITGGCGFIGFNLVKKLIEENHNIVVIDKEIKNELQGVIYINSSTSNKKYWETELNNLKCWAVSMKPLSNKLFITKFLLNFASSIFLYGLYLLGAFGNAANSAASP